MGKFFNTLHVKSSNREAFIKGFEWIMKKEGFVPCADNDEAEVTFAAAFSEGGWVSLSNGEDSADGLSGLSERLAKDLLLPSFTVEAVDSDFAILELCSPDKKTKLRKSRLVVGDGEGYGVEKAPILIDDWQRLFQNGGVEEFLEAAGQDGVFVEDALCELGKILGIKPAVMAWCFDEFEEKIGRGGEVISLMFKKKAEKKLTLNAAFKQVFGEALAPLGYRLIKGKYPYFVRVVPGGEIIQVISVKKQSSFLHAIGREGFTVLSGGATVYRPKIDLSVSPRNNTRWLSDIQRVYIYSNRFNYDSDLSDILSELSFVENDSKSQLEAMKQALDHTKNIVIPALNKAFDVDSFARICFAEHDGLDPERHFDAVKGGELNPNYVDDEGLVLVKVKDYQSFVDWSMEYRKSFNSRRVGYTFDKYSEEDFAEFCGKINEYKQQYLSKMSEIKNDTQFYNLIELELEKRKRMNIETLRSYGIDI